jgi:hypothetical protein
MKACLAWYWLQRSPVSQAIRKKQANDGSGPQTEFNLKHNFAYLSTTLRLIHLKLIWRGKVKCTKIYRLISFSKRYGLFWRIIFTRFTKGSWLMPCWLEHESLWRTTADLLLYALNVQWNRTNEIMSHWSSWHNSGRRNIMCRPIYRCKRSYYVFY